ncbi:MAG: ATP-binding protein [Oscillospiraceae bacterium]
MEELSLNILDVSKNSVSAGAKLIKIILEEDQELFKLWIIDDGCGMDEEKVKNVQNPFFTTRTTRKVGLGIPFLKQSAEQTGGYLKIQSSILPENHGTEVFAVFKKNSIDFTPLGDIISTICILIQGSPLINFYFCHKFNEKEIILETEKLKEILGDEISLANPEILQWIKNYLKEQYKN